MSNNIIKNIPNKVFVRNGNTGFGYPVSPSFIFPTFLFSPYSADYNPTTTFNLYGIVSATGPISYQWYKNDVLISGANNTTYTVTCATTADTAFYKVVATTPLGVITSESAFVYINIPPYFVLEPYSGIQDPSYSFTFTASALGTDPLTYQWLKNGVIIPGANSPSYTIDPVQETDEALYRVSVSNKAGSILSVVASLSVNDPAGIVSDPSDYYVSLINDGTEAATFNVTASGTPPIYYQWWRNTSSSPTFSAIVGANTSSYTTPVLSLSNDGEKFYAAVTNSALFGSVASTQASLSVVPAELNFTTQPVGLTANPGFIATLQSSASGMLPIYYQWYKDGTALSGATTPSLSLNGGLGIIEANQGYYQVSVTNSTSSLTSAPAVLVFVNDPIFITSQPTSISVPIYNNTTFTVSAIGEQPLAYQWYKNSTIINGASSNFYSVTSATSADAGSYFCVLSNVATPSLTTNVAFLTILYPLGIVSTFTNLYDGIGTLLGTTSANPISVNPGTYVTMTISLTGTLTPIYYQWYKNGVALTDETFGNSSALAINTPIGEEWSGVDEPQQGNYQVVVWNLVNSVTSTPTFLNVNNPITILTQPSSITVDAPSNAAFAVSAIGEEPIKYQWYKNSTIISGASSNSYTINSTASSDQGTYVCVLSNVTTTNSLLTTNVARLSVILPFSITSQPINILSSFNGIGNEATFSVTATGGLTPYFYRWYKKEVYVDRFGSPNTVNTLVYYSSSNQFIIDLDRPITTQDFGTYFATVSSMSNKVTTSLSATLTGSMNNIELWNFDLPSISTYSAGYFNGNSALSSASNTDFNLNTTNFTIEGLFYCTTLNSGNQTIIDKDGSSGASYPQYDISVGSDGYLRFIAGDGTGLVGGAGTYGWTNTGPITLSTWHHFAVTRLANNFYLFYDGVLDSVYAVSVPMSASTTKPLLIGYQLGQAQTTYFNGYVSNIRIVKNQALYTGNFTPSKQPLTTTTVGATGSGVVPSLTGTVSLLTLRDSTFIDLSPSTKTLNVIGSLSSTLVTIPFMYDIFLQSMSVGISSGNTQYIVWGDRNYDSSLSSLQLVQHEYKASLSAGIISNLNSALTGFGLPEYPQVYTYSVLATGSDIKYQWYKKQDSGSWTLVPSATSFRYTVDGLDYGITTLYFYVRVYNNVSSVNSLTAEFYANNE